MFDWFEESHQIYRAYRTVEANFMILNNNFLTSLIMKTWVTCALERDCISPFGSNLYCNPNCLQLPHNGCHRYDQDALSIAIGYFIGK